MHTPTYTRTHSAYTPILTHTLGIQIHTFSHTPTLCMCTQTHSHTMHTYAHTHTHSFCFSVLLFPTVWPMEKRRGPDQGPENVSLYRRRTLLCVCVFVQERYFTEKQKSLSYTHTHTYKNTHIHSQVLSQLCSACALVFCETFIEKSLTHANKCTQITDLSLTHVAMMISFVPLVCRRLSAHAGSKHGAQRAVSAEGEQGGHAHTGGRGAVSRSSGEI